jgi:hypothetical protein
MEPKHSSPELNAPSQERAGQSAEQLPTPERGPEAPQPSFERGETSTPERASEHAAQAQAAMAAQDTPISLPTPVVTADDTQQTSAPDDLPAVAADEDLIEKEWVDKAKQIISQTEGDPAQREKEVGRLQADYLKKRYGRDIGEASA